MKKLFMLRHHGKPNITSSKQTLSHMQETKTNKIKKNYRTLVTNKGWWKVWIPASDTRDTELHTHKIAKEPSVLSSITRWWLRVILLVRWLSLFVSARLHNALHLHNAKAEKRGRHKPKRKISIERFHSVILSRVVQSMKKKLMRDGPLAVII